MTAGALELQRLFDTSDSAEAREWVRWLERNPYQSVSSEALRRRAAIEGLLESLSPEDIENVDPGSVVFAVALVDALPWWAPSPEVSVDPDGEVLLDWDYGVRSVFSVGISPHGKLSFAGIFGASTRTGTETFTGEIPAAVLEGIDSVAKDETERIA